MNPWNVGVQNFCPSGISVPPWNVGVQKFCDVFSKKNPLNQGFRPRFSSVFMVTLPKYRRLPTSIRRREQGSRRFMAVPLRNFHNTPNTAPHRRLPVCGMGKYSLHRPRWRQSLAVIWRGHWRLPRWWRPNISRRSRDRRLNCKCRAGSGPLCRGRSDVAPAVWSRQRSGQRVGNLEEGNLDTHVTLECGCPEFL